MKKNTIAIFIFLNKSITSALLVPHFALPPSIAKKKSVYWPSRRSVVDRSFAGLPLITAQPIKTAIASSSTEEESSATLGTRTSTPGSVLGLGENDALTYLQSGSHCTDFFFDTVPSIKRDELLQLLTKSWDEDPLITLKIIFQLGDPRNGKQDLPNFYQSMLWLYEHHIDTFLLNLKHVPKFSYYKSLLDILQLACEGHDALDDKRWGEFTHWKERKQRKLRTSKTHLQEFFKSLPDQVAQQWNAENCKSTIEYEDADYLDPPRRCWKDDNMRKLFVDFMHSSNKIKSSEARVLRKAKYTNMKAHADTKRREDANYAKFYESVAQIFAENLQEEQGRMLNGTKSLSGLAAKWAPSVRGSHDRHTNIVDGIVEKLFPEDIYRIPEGTHEEYLSFMTDRYRKEYLTPQRKAAQVPEHFTGTAEWELVNYARMASRCRRIHGHIYEHHDGDRYRQYIEDAKKDFVEGKKLKKIVAGALLPHEITMERVPSRESEVNLQWLRLVQDTKNSGALPSALSICDVSGSMQGEPMEVAVALSILVSDIADGFWKNKIVTFSEAPKLETIPEATADNLWERVAKVKGMDWGYNTDFQKVFELLLETATFFNVPKEDMPQLLFCFSDMEFDVAHHNNEGVWATDVELIRAKYAAAGYAMPQLVFWNLRSSRSKPASSSEPGVAMLSGFSAGLMKSFLKFQLQDFSPQTQLIKALTPYQCLEVADTDQ